MAQRFEDRRLGRGVEHRRRLVEGQQHRALQHGAGHRNLLPLRREEARAAGADRVIEPDRDDQRAQIEFVEHLADRGMHAFESVGLAAQDRAEQDVLLDRHSGVVAFRIEELDRTAQILRQSCGEGMPRGEDALPHRLVDETEPVARRDQPQRQAEKACAIALRQPVETVALGARDDPLKPGDVLPADDVEFLEEGVAGRQVPEQFGDHARQPVPGLHEIVGQAGLIEHPAHIGVLREAAIRKGRADRGAEQQVCGDRRARVVALAVETLDQRHEPLCGEPLIKAPPRFEQPLGGVGVALRVEPAAQPETVEVALETGDPHDLQQAPLQRGGILDPGLPVIDPIGGDIELAIARAARLLDRTRARFVIGNAAIVGAVAQPEQQVLANAGGEEVGRGADIADQPARGGKRQRGEIDAAQRDLAAARHVEARQQLRHQILAAIARPHKRDMRAERKGEVEPVEKADAVAVDETDIGQFDLVLRRFYGAPLVEQQARVEHIGYMKLLDDLLVLDRDVLLVLVEVEQFLPWRRQFLVCREHRDQRAERQFARDDEIAADQVEEKRRQLVDQVVDEFDKELAVVDVEADVVDLAEAVRDVGELMLRAGIGADLDLRGDRLADAV